MTRRPLLGLAFKTVFSAVTKPNFFLPLVSFRSYNVNLFTQKTTKLFGIVVG